MLEGTLHKQNKEYFKSLGPNCLAIAKDQGPYSGRRGISDWIICYRGKFIVIEEKVGKNTPTELQSHFLKDAEAAGAIIAVCYSLKETKKLMKNINSYINMEITDWRIGRKGNIINGSMD